MNVYLPLRTPGCLHQNVFFPARPALLWPSLDSALRWCVAPVPEDTMRHVHMEVWNIKGLVEAPSYRMASPRINQPHFPLIGPGNYVENSICLYLETWFIIQRPGSYFRRFYTYKQADRISSSTWKWNFSTTGMDLDGSCPSGYEDGCIWYTYYIHITAYYVLIDAIIVYLKSERSQVTEISPYLCMYILYVYTYCLYTLYIHDYTCECLHTWLYADTKT